ncbi:UNVERIFIED_CONTAM: hypothetical protein PYX00_003618 [Menopon gallinae]|uniref:t-SNARE coiled-coil homology domain-containing protein n=1 Tax=Menopon gallinae TaxID=328185 RepID=A0AAW2I2F6_9NEOP
MNKMAVRSLTDVFTFMRNNAIKNRNCLHDQEISDRAAFLESESDFKCDISSYPPTWVDFVDECQIDISTLTSKINDLDQKYKKNMYRPTLNDSTEDQHQIEAHTREISRLFNKCHGLVDKIKSHSQHGNGQERLLAQNVMLSLVSSLQNASNNFRTTQNQYLKNLDSREERSKQYLDILDQDFRTSEVDTEMHNIDQVFGRGPSFQMSQQQLLLIEEDNTRLVEQREEEVKQIVKSIVELNEIFKDLARFVTTQGTVLDRIDYNIENTSIQVHQGFQQLQRAESYQKKNRKMKCIVCLAVVTILMFILLVIFKLV